MPMTQTQIANAIKNHETFVCAWCYDFEPDTPEEYTYGYDWLGGYDNETGKPICAGCADTAREDALSDHIEAT